MWCLLIITYLVFALCTTTCAQAADASPPDLLTAADGTRIDTAQLWETKRRPEVLDLLSAHVYGQTPIGRPTDMTFQVIRESKDVIDGAVGKEVDITFKGPGGQGVIHLTLFVPAARTAPAPVFLLICNRGRRTIDPTRATKSPFWPAEKIVARGYAAAAFHYSDVAVDKPEGLQGGVFSVFGDATQPRKPNAWGAIGAWAWGASRVLDYLETNPDVDAGRVVVVGHSRGGKTALWAGAQDQRFAMAVSNESGAAGAALARGHRGERIADSIKTFPYWYCPNYALFVDRESELPIDQHMLIAAMAPRPVYVASAQEDAWADPANEFRSCMLATPAWRLYDAPGLPAQTMPDVQAPIHDGTIGYHIRSGKHNLTEYDWERFMDFADRRLKASSTK